MTVRQSTNPENLGSAVSPRIAATISAATAAASATDPIANGISGQAAPSSIKSVCRHCGRPITRDLEYELHLPAEGQRWYHDDFVDGAEDAPCTGVSCQNETADQDATEAEPPGEVPEDAPEFLPKETTYLVIEVDRRFHTRYCWSLAEARHGSFDLDEILFTDMDDPQDLDNFLAGLKERLAPIWAKKPEAA